MTEEDVVVLHEAACLRAGRELTPLNCAGSWGCNRAQAGSGT
jgi:hypothetical protein